MTVTVMGILHNEGAAQHSLGLDKASRDALATYCRMEWPSNTAKHVARAWSLSLDEARGVVAGRTSLTTIDKIFKHPNGGWQVVLPVLGAVIGHGVDVFFRRQMIEAAKAAEHAQQHEQLAKIAYRRLQDRAPDLGEDRRKGRGAGTMVSAQARRLAGGGR